VAKNVKYKYLIKTNFLCNKGEILSGNHMEIKMENLNYRLTQIKQGLKSHSISEESQKMTVLCDLLIDVNNELVKELHSSRTWNVDDRKGYKGFVFQCENFIRLNCELLLPSNI
jgi:hypothetical protein